MKTYTRLALFAAIVLLSAVPVLEAQVSPEAKPVRFRGQIKDFKGDNLILETPSGEVQVKVPERVKLQQEIPIKLTDIKPGMFVAASAVKQADGTFRASRINVFPEEQRGSGEGHRPQTSQPGSTMTNANVEKIEDVAVESVTGRLLTLKFKEGEVKVFVAPDTSIVKRVLGDKKLLAPGAIVSVQGSQAADGTLSATQIDVSAVPRKPPA